VARATLALRRPNWTIREIQEHGVVKAIEVGGLGGEAALVVDARSVRFALIR